MFIATSLLLVKSISLFGSEYYWEFLWNDLNKVVYFFVPLLFISNIEIFRKVGWLIVFIAITGCVSAFLVSIGLISLPISVPVEYRISWLPRAKGLFLSTGNLAQYLAFAIAMVVVAPGVLDKKINYLRLIRWILALSVIMGLLATQSRNVFLVLVVSLFALQLSRKMGEMSSGAKALVFFGLIAAVFLPLLSVFIFYFSDILNTVASAGGDYAETSVMSRFAQYVVAWDVISSNPLLGVDAETYRRVGPIVDHIHNMWLQLLTHGGLTTFILMITLLLSSFKGVRRVAHVTGNSDETVIVTMYFASMLVAVMFYIGLDKMYWTLLGVATSLACFKPVDNINQSNKGDVSDKIADSSVNEVKKYYTGVTLR